MEPYATPKPQTSQAPSNSGLQTRKQKRKPTMKGALLREPPGATAPGIRSCLRCHPQHWPGGGSSLKLEPLLGLGVKVRVLGLRV